MAQAELEVKEAEAANPMLIVDGRFMKDRTYKGLLFVATLMALDWSVKRVPAWWDQFRDIVGSVQQSGPIDVTCKIEEKQTANGERKVVGRAVIPDNVHANHGQLRTTILSLLDSMVRKFPGNRLYVLLVSNDERMLACGNTTCTAVMRNGKTEIAGGLPTKLELLRAKADGIDAAIPTEERIEVTTAVHAARARLFEQKCEKAKALRGKGLNKAANSVDQTPVEDSDACAMVAREKHLDAAMVAQMYTKTKSYYLLKSDVPL